MVEQYKLRLGDGTILAVDYDGLRTWLLDADAMVQPPGSRRWRPLRQHLVEEPNPPVRRAPPSPPPPPASPTPSPTTREAEPPPSAPGTAAPPAAVEAPPTPVAARAATPEPTDFPVIPLRPLDAPPTPIVLAPVAEPPVAVPPVRAEDEAPFYVSAEAAGASLRDVAVAEVERHGGGDRVWQWTPPESRTAAAPGPDLVPAPIPDPVADPDASDVGEPREDFEIVAAEDAPAAPPPRIRPRPDPPVPAPPATLAPAVPPPPAPALVDAVLRQMAVSVELLVARLRQLRAPRPAAAPALRPSAEAPARDVRQPPPPLSALPTIPFAPDEDALKAAALARAPRRKGTWVVRGLVAAGVVTVAIAAIATRSAWMSALSSLSASAEKVASPAPPPPPPVPEPPPLPREVQVAIAHLPHLSTETVQLVMSASERGLPEPAEVFRHAHDAAIRGAAALTDEEARELRALESSALSALSRSDRARVRAYDRMSPERDLLVGEDGKVMALFTRGVRALSPPRRERLQALMGKAIAAELGRRPPVAEARP